MLNYATFVKRKLILYRKRQIIYTKPYIASSLKKHSTTKKEIERNLRFPTKLRYAEKQIKMHKGLPDERYLSHFIYSCKRGLSSAIKFNHNLYVITAYPAGRKTIKKIRRRFKW